jgi:hypothetical protein
MKAHIGARQMNTRFQRREDIALLCVCGAIIIVWAIGFALDLAR